MQYDLVVIGSGPAGEKGAAQAAYFGKRVALVERLPDLGGAGCNTGTLPSKSLRETAVTVAGFRTRSLPGLHLSVRESLSIADLLHHEHRVIEAERQRIAANLRRHNVDVYHGTASFADAGTVTVAGMDSATLEGDVILIATGSSPHRPAGFPFDDPRVWDSDRVPEMESLPRRIAVIGGGVIGCEYACVFAALGSEVHLADERARPMPVLDDDIWDALRASMGDLGVNLITGAGVAACHAAADSVNLDLTSGESLEVDAVLVSTGRQGNTTGLALEAAGLEADSRGRIAVNDHYQTAVPHIYAAGDVIGFPALASTSAEQARVAMVHAFNLEYKSVAAPILPIGMYTIPEVSVAGETEQTLAEKGIPYIAGRARYDDNARGMIIGCDRGFLKLLFHEDDMRLLGVAAIGEGASEIIHTGLLALMSGADNTLFIDACFNYPTLGQLYKYATYDAMGARSRDHAAAPR